MIAFQKLVEAQRRNNSLLCIGLDPQIDKLPNGISKDVSGIFEFNKTIIEHTKNLVCAYKINLAFYEQFGAIGFELLEKTIQSIPKDVVTIADGKRSDIGNTSKAYARGIFEYFHFDCATLNPFMGLDSLEPFFDYKDKLNFVLACTSNPGSADFQKLKVGKKFLFEIVVEKFAIKFKTENLGFVVGATNEMEFQTIRELASENFILVPGIGAQGGSIHSILEANKGRNIIINVARDIIFASQDKNFVEKVTEKALFYRNKLRFNNYAR